MQYPLVMGGLLLIVIGFVVLAQTRRGGKHRRFLALAELLLGAYFVITGLVSEPPSWFANTLGWWVVAALLLLAWWQAAGGVRRYRGLRDSEEDRFDDRVGPS